MDSHNKDQRSHWSARKSPIHLPAREVLNRPIVIFVTVCTQRRKPVLANPEAHKVIVQAWRQAGVWLVGRYVLMPDHIHLFCSPGVPDFRELQKWVQYWKALASLAWPRPSEHPVWQKSFWDTQLRQGDSYEEKWEYVRNNPVRKNLASTPDEWPYQGELNELQWL